MNENNKEQTNKNKDFLSNLNLSISNKNLFITKNFNLSSNININNDTEKLDDKVCPECKWSFYSNFSMGRHRENAYLIKNLMICPICKKKYKDLKKHMKTCRIPKRINSKVII